MANMVRILLMRLDRLGDLVLTLPAIYSVHENFPNAKIDLVVNEQLVGFVDNIYFISDIYSINPYKFEFLRFLKFIFLLRRKHYDLAIDLLPRASHLSSIILFAIKSIHKAGVAVGLRKYFIDCQVPPTVEPKYQRDVVLGILKHVGLKTNKKITLPINEDSKKYVHDFLRERNINLRDVIVGISPGASGGFKMWPEQNFGMLLKKLHQQYKCKLLLLGSKQERSLCDEINLSAGNIAVNVAGLFSLKELCACINMLDLFICNNSGPMHIAYALNTPSVIISGFANPKRWTLPRSNFVVIHKDSRDFESEHKEASNVSRISIDEVFNEVKKLLNQTNTGAVYN